MKQESFNGHTLEMYISIDELPVTRFMAYNHFTLIDAGLGSDLNDVDRHIGTLGRFIASGDKENAKKELLNLRQNLAFVISRVSPRAMSFVPFIHSMNGSKITDVTEEGAGRVVLALSEKGMSWGLLNRLLTAVKKKLSPSLLFSFRTLRKRRS